MLSQRRRKNYANGNDHSANYILQTWLSVNEDLLADLAFEIAKFHIGHAVPDPADHLKNARRLLDLARSAAPRREEIRDLWLQFDNINEALQEQVIKAGEEQIGWNSGIRPELLVQTFRDIARYCYDTCQYLLAALFADRAVSIAPRRWHGAAQGMPDRGDAGCLIP